MKYKPKNLNPVWYIIAFFMLIPIIYSLFQLSNKNYIDSFIGNWFATVIGAVLGIPIALELFRVQQKKEESIRMQKEKEETSKQEKQREHEELEHQKKILFLLINEIKQNIEHLTREPQHTFSDKVFQDSGMDWDNKIFQYAKKANVCNLYNLIKTENWKLFTEGGEIHWIKDLDLLDTLAQAYFILNTFTITRESFKSNIQSLDAKSFDTEEEFACAIDLFYETFIYLVRTTADSLENIMGKLTDHAEAVDFRLTSLQEYMKPSV